MKNKNEFSGDGCGKIEFGETTMAAISISTVTTETLFSRGWNRYNFKHQRLDFNEDHLGLAQLLPDIQQL